METITLEISKLIDRLADAYEAERRQGKRPDIISLLEDVPTEARSRLLIELILLDKDYCEKEGLEESTYRLFDYLDKPEAIQLQHDISTRTDLQIKLDTSEAFMIDKYQVLQTLGAGGQATVYRVLHKDLSGRTAVLKLMNVPKDHDGKNFTNSVELESDILSKLNLRNVVEIYDIGEFQGRPYFVMADVGGRTLGQVIKEKSQDKTWLLKRIAVIARTLYALHNEGICHRDIKPNNIVIDPEGNPYLIDFGVHLIRDAWRSEEEPSEFISGTLTYMSPEQARAEETDGKSDQYSLGLILYLVLTGQTAFSGQDLKSLYPKVRDSELDREALRRSGHNKSLVDICLKSIEPDKDNRFSNMLKMAIRIERATHKTTLPPRMAVIIILLVSVMLTGLLVINLIDKPNIKPITDYNVTNAVSDTVNHAQRPGALPLTVKVLEGDQDYELINVVPVHAGHGLSFETDIPNEQFGGLIFWQLNGRPIELGSVKPEDDLRQIRFPKDLKERKPWKGDAGLCLILTWSSASQIDMPAILDRLKSDIKQKTMITPEDNILAMVGRKFTVMRQGKSFGKSMKSNNPQLNVQQLLENIRDASPDFQGLTAITFVYSASKN